MDREMKVADNLTVRITVDQQHEFLMPTSEVAVGYGVSRGAIRMQMERNPEEFVEGKHFIKGVTIRDTLQGQQVQPHQFFWTKRGIVRLGFFIKSERAKLFRDWAEDLVIFAADHAAKAEQLQLWPTPEKRKHNRLTQERLVGIAGDKAIIYGCELENGNARRKEGYVFVRTTARPSGEVLWFEGGNVSAGMYIKTEAVSVSAQGKEYPQAYTERWLAAGAGSEWFSRSGTML